MNARRHGSPATGASERIDGTIALAKASWRADERFGVRRDARVARGDHRVARVRAADQSTRATAGTPRTAETVAQLRINAPRNTTMPFAAPGQFTPSSANCSQVTPT